MRWFRPRIIILEIVCILVICFFTFEKNELFQITIFSNPSTLSHRNNQRWNRLHEKYNILVNLTNFQTNSLSNKTIIYSCRSFCGGWGDRLRGILSVYILSLLTNRRFMIDMHYPCDITKIVQPNFVNWTYVSRPKTVNRTHLYINTMASWRTAYRKEIADTIRSKNFLELWSSYDDIFISTNSDYMILALHNSHMLNRTRKLLGRLPSSQATMQTLFPLLFDLLFKPSTSVENHVNKILSAAYQRHLICLHVRIGKNPNNPLDHAFTARVNTTEAMLNFTDNYLKNKSSSIVFITADSGQAVTDVLRHYPTNAMTIVGPILHIDRFDRRSSNVCDGFVKVIADFYLLGECQTSLLSSSGFSFWANRRREKPNEELYFYNEKLHQMRKS